MGVTSRDHISNSERYFGHVTSMDKCRLPYIALYSRVDGNRQNIENGGRTMLQKTVYAMAGILWRLAMAPPSIAQRRCT